MAAPSAWAEAHSTKRAARDRHGCERSCKDATTAGDYFRCVDSFAVRGDGLAIVLVSPRKCTPSAWRAVDRSGARSAVRGDSQLIVDSRRPLAARALDFVGFLRIVLLHDNLLEPGIGDASMAEQFGRWLAGGGTGGAGRR